MDESQKFVVNDNDDNENSHDNNDPRDIKDPHDDSDNDNKDSHENIDSYINMDLPTKWNINDKSDSLTVSLDGLKVEYSGENH